jgi:hypothetical protein
MILIFGFCQIFAILGLGQVSSPEYETVGLHPGEFLWTLRLSMGDFSAIVAAKDLDSNEVKIFWFFWLLAVIVTCIIFLNFVVAEACASYSKVVDFLDQVVLQAQASLITESERMMMTSFKNSQR